MSVEVSAEHSMPQQGWFSALMVLALVWCGLFLSYMDTFTDMVNIWRRSETYAHGFFVFPVSLWLVWRQREHLAAIRPHPSPGMALLLVPIGLLWFVSHMAAIRVGEQLAFVLLLQGSVLPLLGWRVSRPLLFPLGFLFFMVPMGEALIPPLMDFTAAFTVYLLRLTGIPVYDEGTFFSIPGSDWSVVEGCSGIRYLIASVFLGTLYAYLNYRHFWKRMLFILISVVVPIIANGLRAYMIVMIAHLSDMKLALGIDHFVYGWVFFGLVILLLFWIGSFWRDVDTSPSGRVGAVDTGTQPHVHIGRVAGTTVVVLALGGVWPAWADFIERLQGVDGTQTVRIALPERIGAWSKTKQFTDWRPHYVGAASEVEATYARDSIRVGVHLAYYPVQRQGAELINSRNYLVPQKHVRWRNLGERRVRRRGVPGEVVEAVLDAPDQRLLVYRFYWLDGRLTANPWLAKLMEVFDRLGGRFPPAAGVILYAEFDEDPAAGRRTLDAFLEEGWPTIETLLHAAGKASG